MNIITLICFLPLRRTGMMRHFGYEGSYLMPGNGSWRQGGSPSSLTVDLPPFSFFSVAAVCSVAISLSAMSTAVSTARE
jgi:hypothetical protein